MKFCEVKHVNYDVVKEIRGSLPNPDEIENLSNLFKGLGDPTRMKILSALARHELCVCDLTELLEMKQSTISQQLRVLKQLKLIKYRKEGRSVFYSMDDSHIEHLYEVGLEHVRE